MGIVWRDTWSNCGMRKILVWYEILLKENLLRKTTWISVISMLCLLVVVAKIRIPTVENRMIGICSADTATASAIINDLYEQKGAFDYKLYVNNNRLYEDVESGKLECGFILSDQLQEKLKAGNPDKCVKYVSSPYSTKGEVAKETFFASFLRIYSEQILRQSEKEIFQEPDFERMEAMLKANERFMQSEFFQLEQVAVDADVKNKKEGTCYPVQGLFGIFLLGFMYFANERKFESGRRWTRQYLTHVETISFSMAQTFGAVCVPAIVGLITIFQLSVVRSAPEEICRLLLFLLIGIPWIVWYAGLAQTQESFIAFGILLLVMDMLLYPVVVDITVYIPMLKIFRYMTPLGFIL